MREFVGGRVCLLILITRRFFVFVAGGFAVFAPNILEDLVATLSLAVLLVMHVLRRRSLFVAGAPKSPWRRTGTLVAHISSHGATPTHCRYTIGVGAAANRKIAAFARRFNIVHFFL